jgi:hypothetical protein
MTPSSSRPPIPSASPTRTGARCVVTTTPRGDATNQRYYTDSTIPTDGSVGNYKIVWEATYGSNSWVVSREFAVEAP